MEKAQTYTREKGALNLPGNLSQLTQTATRLLESKHISPTPHRTLLLTLLLQKDYHPTAEELEEAASEYLPVGTTTVYLALKMFLALRLVHSFADTAGKVRYGGYTRPHAHRHCLICKTTVDVDLDQAHLRIPLPEGWHPAEEAPTVLAYGFCPTCATAVASKRT